MNVETNHMLDNPAGQLDAPRSSASLTQTRQGSEAWTEEEQQESLMQACTPGRRSVLSAVLSSCQAYLAFINKEVESCILGHGALGIGRLPTLNHQGVPTLDPRGPMGEGSSIAMQGVGCVDGKETEN